MEHKKPNYKIKALEITSALDGGGVDRLLYDYCSRLSKEIDFDFVVTTAQKGLLEPYLENYGYKIFRVVPIKKNPIKHVIQMHSILKSGRYDVVHNHSGFKAGISLALARIVGIKVRIAHSHIAYIPESKFQLLERKASTILTRLSATELFACGKSAAEWTWGNKSKVHIVNNAIETDKFIFSPEKRSLIREKLNLGDKYVIGNVARFTYQKNHDFLIDIFEKVKERRENAVLLLIGNGELEESIKDKIEKRGLTRDTLFLGVTNNVGEYLNAMDVFCLPSRFEGLGMVFIEAQTNGLKCITSSNCVPEEANILGGIKYISLSCAADKWADEIVDSSERINCNRECIASKGYDMDYEANKLGEKYRSLVVSN